AWPPVSHAVLMKLSLSIRRTLGVCQSVGRDPPAPKPRFPVMVLAPRRRAAASRPLHVAWGQGAEEETEPCRPASHGWWAWKTRDRAVHDYMWQSGGTWQHYLG